MATMIQLLRQDGTIPGHPAPEAAYFDHPVHVPERVAQLHITIQYHRPLPAWDILMLVFDPLGLRGDACLNATRVGPAGDVELGLTLGGPESPTNCLSGPIRPGTWLIQVWAGHVDTQLSYRVLVDALLEDGESLTDSMDASQGAGQPPSDNKTTTSSTTAGSAASAPQVDCPATTTSVVVPRLDYVQDNAPGWYLGELHTHTVFSDGFFTPNELLARARSSGLRFIALTDHNSIGGWYGMPQSDDLCVIPSLEVTLPGGHCNLLGLSAWVDWREAYRKRSISDVIDAAHAQDGLVVVNHPFAPGYSWSFDTDLESVDCIEVLNYPAWWPAATEYNVMALGLWDWILNAGFKLPAVGGSDVFHLMPGDYNPGSPYPEDLAQPGTCVYVPCLSAVTVLDALRHGASYVTMGSTLRFQATVAGSRYEMGEQIQAASGRLDFEMVLDNAPSGGTLRWIKNGRVLDERVLSSTVQHCHFHDDPDWSVWNWYRVDVLNAQHELWVVGNPIYAGRRQMRRLTWQEAVKQARAEGRIPEQTIFE